MEVEEEVVPMLVSDEEYTQTAKLMIRFAAVQAIISRMFVETHNDSFEEDIVIDSRSIGYHTRLEIQQEMKLNREQICHCLRTLHNDNKIMYEGNVIYRI